MPDSAPQHFRQLSPSLLTQQFTPDNEIEHTKLTAVSLMPGELHKLCTISMSTFQRGIGIKVLCHLFFNTFHCLLAY